MYRYSAVVELLELCNPAVNYNVDSVLSRNFHKAIVQVMTMNKPPGVARRSLDSFYLRVADRSPVFLSEIEVLETYKIVANRFVNAISDEQSGDIWSLSRLANTSFDVMDMIYHLDSCANLSQL